MVFPTTGSCVCGIRTVYPYPDFFGEDRQDGRDAERRGEAGQTGTPQDRDAREDGPAQVGPRIPRADVSRGTGGAWHPDRSLQSAGLGQQRGKLPWLPCLAVR